MKETRSCSVCGSLHPVGELVEYDDSYLCDICLYTEITRCQRCGERIWTDDNAGIAYNAGGKQIIHKRPLLAHLMWFRVPVGAAVVMGHTRMATNGDPRINAHNHPFSGCAGYTRFALAHNGVLYNDKALRRQFRIPETRIETDSYVAVQLLEKHAKPRLRAG